MICWKAKVLKMLMWKNHLFWLIISTFRGSDPDPGSRFLDPDPTKRSGSDRIQIPNITLCTNFNCSTCIPVYTSVAEPHHFHAAPAALAPAPTQVGSTLSSAFCIFEVVINMNGRNKKIMVCEIFINLPAFDLKFGAGYFRAGAALGYGSGSGSTKMMRLLVAPASQHWYIQFIILFLSMNSPLL
jgi:hypothetical protein